jgi:hypothetical protein
MLLLLCINSLLQQYQQGESVVKCMAYGSSGWLTRDERQGGIRKLDDFATVILIYAGGPSAVLGSELGFFWSFIYLPSNYFILDLAI